MSEACLKKVWDWAKHIPLNVWDWLRGQLYRLTTWFVSRCKNCPWLFFPLLVAFLLLLFDFNIKWLAATAIPLLYLAFCVHTRQEINTSGTIVALLCAAMIGIGPTTIKDKLRTWSAILEERVVSGGGVSVQAFGGSITLDKDSKNMEKSRMLDAELIPTMATDSGKNIAECLARREPGNIIQNGDFLISLGSLLSPWGHGQYTDALRRRFQKWNTVLVNFADARVNIRVEQTEKGPALRIDHQSMRLTNSVGIIEQYIRYTPGRYQLSLLAKGINVEADALFLATTADWEPVDNSAPLNWRVIPDFPRRRYDLPIAEEAGTFPWKSFECKIRMDDSNSTFTIVSQGRGVIYLTDINLVRIGD